MILSCPFSTRLTTRRRSAAAVEGCRLRIAGDGGFETTVDQTLMRGLDTARPRFRLGPASVSSRASILSATESHRGLPYRAAASGDAQILMRSRMLVLLLLSRSIARAAMTATCCDRPHEGGEFASDRDIDDIARLSRLCEPAMSGAKPHLGLPGDVLDRSAAKPRCA